MTGRVGFLLGGPVLRREFARAVWRPLPLLLRYTYAAWLIGQLIVVLPEYAEREYQARSLRFGTPVYGVRYVQPSLPELLRARHLALVGAATKYAPLLLHQQLLLVIFLTPALTAGALVVEKERDTLQALYGTELGSFQIVAGKLLGRLAALAWGASPAVPLLVFGATLAELPLGPLLLAFVQAGVLAFALAAGCLLLSVWTRRVTDAIVASYSAMTVCYLGGLLALANAPVPPSLDPTVILDQLLPGGGGLRPLAFLAHVAFWGGAGVLCFALTAARLHPAYVRQAESRPWRWLWAFRPGIGDDPIRWREQHVLGLAPLPVLRMIPGWLGRLAVLTFSAILALEALDHTSAGGFFLALKRGKFALAWEALKNPYLSRLWEDIHIMGIALLVLGTLTAGLRCAGSIAEEKRRKTWDDLVLTPLALEEIVFDKWWGVVRASVPYLAIYALPMVALSSRGGAGGLALAATWLVTACVLIVLAAAAGMAVAADVAGVSARERAARPGYRPAVRKMRYPVD
jgi:hypothetical protein